MSSSRVVCVFFFSISPFQGVLIVFFFVKGLKYFL